MATRVYHFSDVFCLAAAAARRFAIYFGRPFLFAGTLIPSLFFVANTSTGEHGR